MADNVVDACCLINLYASGEVTKIVGATAEEFYVVEQVRNEALTIRQPDPEDISKLVQVPIDLDEAVREGFFRECRLEQEAELEAFVRFATQLDDGEASCLALAEQRGWTVATDDRKAIRIAGGSNLSVVTTPELIRQWKQFESPPDAEVAEVLRRIERFARFRPHRSSPFHVWWVDLVERANP